MAQRTILQTLLLALGALQLAGCEVAPIDTLGGPGGRVTTGRPDLRDAGVPDLSASRDLGQTRDAGRRDMGVRVDAGVPRDAGGPFDAGPPTDIADRLRAIAGLDVLEVPPQVAGTRAFLLEFRQPENHRRPQGVTFLQRLVLIHQDENAPMVLFTTGYGMFGDPLQFVWYLAEPTAALGANQLAVEHRFFGTSIAPNADWRHLNVEQSANDSHRIYEVFSQIYGASWIGSGASKGGLTALLHERYFPDDLEGVVAYVAPITFGDSDPRYIPFVDGIGPADGFCRGRVKDMTIEIVERRAEAAQYLLQSDPAAGMFSLSALEAIIAYAVYVYHWTFWQYLGSDSVCASLPPRGAPIDVIVPWFGIDLAGFLDQGRFDPELTPYSYQVAFELGSPAVDSSYLEPVLLQVDFSEFPEIVVDPEPWGAPPLPSAQPMLELDAFLRTDAERVLGIYGAWDPWTAGMITLDFANDGHTLIAPGLNHAAAIADLPVSLQDLALRRLFEWAGRRSLTAPSEVQLRAARARLAVAGDEHRAFMERVFEYEQRARAHARFRHPPR